MMKQRRMFVTLGLGILACWLGACPSANPGNSNDNDNSNSNVNNNDNGGGEEDGIEPGVEFEVPNEGAQHVPVGEQVIYEHNPPASGSHWSAAGIAPVPAGFYEEAVEEEQWIHNLEHGYVVFLYDCGGPCQPALLDDLQGLFDAAPPSQVFGNTKLVIAPYDGLPFAIAAVAWDRQLHLETIDEAALLEFYETYVDQGPESTP